MTTCQAQIKLTVGGPFGEGWVGKRRMRSRLRRGERQKGVFSVITVKAIATINQELA